MNPEEMSMVKAALTPVVQDVQDQGMWIFLPPVPRWNHPDF